MNRRTLGAVHLLDFGHQVDLHGPLAEHPEHVVRVDRAGDQLLADRDVVTVVDEQPDPLGHRIRVLLRTVVRNHDDLAGLLGVLDPNGLVLHDLGQAAGYADQVAVVADGAVIATGASADFITDENVARAFDLSVTILRDPGTGHVDRAAAHLRRTVRKFLGAGGGIAVAVALVLGLAACSGKTADGRSCDDGMEGAITLTTTAGEVALDKPATKIVALEWTYVEDLLAIGVTPVGVADIKGYDTWVTAGARVPEGVKDVGTRQEPSIEEIRALAPDLLITDEDRVAANRDALADIALLATYNYTKDPEGQYASMRKIVQQMGLATGKTTEAEQVLTDLDTKIATATEAITAKDKTGALLTQKVYDYSEGHPPVVREPDPPHRGEPGGQRRREREGRSTDARHKTLAITKIYARIADRTVADEYFTVTKKVEALYDQPRRLASDDECHEMRNLRSEMHRRMLGNGYCARPVEMDCHFESIGILQLLRHHHRIPPHPAAATRRRRPQGSTRTSENLRRHPRPTPHRRILTRPLDRITRISTTPGASTPVSADCPPTNTRRHTPHTSPRLRSNPSPPKPDSQVSGNPGELRASPAASSR